MIRAQALDAFLSTDPDPGELQELQFKKEDIEP